MDKVEFNSFAEGVVPYATGSHLPQQRTPVEIFCHVNDLHQPGWCSLRTLVLACPRVVLWAPSAHLLKSYGMHPELPTPDELIWYISNGFIQVMAREWWIKNDPKRVRHKWPSAKWDSDFDSAILKIWEEDQRSGRTGLAGRVIAVADSNAWNWAEQKVSENAIDIDDVKLKAQQYIPEVRDKVAKIKDKRLAAITLLKDLKEHGEAFAWSGANRNLGAVGDIQMLQLFQETYRANAPPVRTLYRTPPPDIMSILDVIEAILITLQSARRPLSNSKDGFLRTQMVLEDEEELRKFRDFVRVCDSFVSTVSVEYLQSEAKNILTAQLEAHASTYKWSDLLLARTPWLRWVQLLSLSYTACSYAVTGTISPVSLLPVAARMIDVATAWLGLRKEESTGPVWPFYLAEGAKTPSRIARAQIVCTLRD